MKDDLDFEILGVRYEELRRDLKQLPNGWELLQLFCQCTSQLCTTPSSLVEH